MLVFWDVDGNTIVEGEDKENPVAENLCGSSSDDIISISEALEKALGSKPEALYTLSVEYSGHNVGLNDVMRVASNKKTSVRCSTQPIRTAHDIG